MKYIKTLTTLSAAALAVLSMNSTTVKAEYYSGKTITMIVGFGPGGTNTMSRFFAQHLEKHIAGNPNVIVKNMPGAASLKAMNFLRHKARPDGMTIGFNPFQVAAQVSGARGMRFKYEDFEYVAGLQGGPGMVLALAKLPSGKVKVATDLLNIKGLKYAGRNPIHGSDVSATATLDLLGIKYDYVYEMEDCEIDTVVWEYMNYRFLLNDKNNNIYDITTKDFLGRRILISKDKYTIDCDVDEET